jgi:hypothetical protein
MNDRTLVMIPMSKDHTPVEPHIPGTYVVGYIAGTESDVEETLNACAQAETNVRIENAYLVVLGITFAPMKANPHDERQFNPQLPMGHPAQPEMKLALKHALSMMPLTQMDHSMGLTYSMPVKNMHWVYPKGSMIQDLESQMELTRKQLTESRSGVTVASAEALARLNQQNRPS